MRVCHNCEYRTPTCHAGCEEYAADKREHDIWASKVCEAKEKQMDADGVRTAAVEKYMRKNRRV